MADGLAAFLYVSPNQMRIIKRLLIIVGLAVLCTSIVRFRNKNKPYEAKSHKLPDGLRIYLGDYFPFLSPVGQLIVNPYAEAYRKQQQNSGFNYQQNMVK